MLESFWSRGSDKLRSLYIHRRNEVIELRITVRHASSQRSCCTHGCWNHVTSYAVVRTYYNEVIDSLTQPVVAISSGVVAAGKFTFSSTTFLCVLNGIVTWSNLFDALETNRRGLCKDNMVHCLRIRVDEGSWARKRAPNKHMACSISLKNMTDEAMLITR